ncbi:MAG: outer rane autotransporter, partial [Moraxellaceae bacterium]|nr:outer rane autotransporter [Moraxellaceae bacterium]
EAVIANDGTLVADAKSDGVASAYGIRIDWLGSDARVENTGTIHANGNALGQSYAVYANSGSGTVFNSGTMLAGVYLGADSEKDDSLFVRNYDGHGISLVNAGSITTLIDSPSYVGGDYTQLAGGMLGFAVRDLQHYGRIDVAGTADFSAGNALSVQVDPVHKFVAGDVLHNVIASDDLVADGFTVTDNSVFWTFAPRIEGAYVDLVVGYVAPEAAVAGSGLNISATLSGLVDYVIAEGEYGKYGTLAAALNSASTADAAADVLEHVAPVLTAGAAQAMRMAGSGAANAIGTRLAETRGAASGDVARDGAVWVKPFVGKAEQDDANGVSGYEADSDGVVVGIDANLTDAWRAGVALASATSDVESRISGVEVETTQLTVYGSYAMDERTALDLSASMGMHGYDGRRLAIDGSTALSDFDGTQLALGAQFSRSYKLGSSTTLIPSLGLQLRQATLDAYSETGAGIYNLNVQEAQEDSFLIAAKGTLEQKLGKGIFLASFGVAHDSVDVASATASLSGNGPTFVTNGIEPDALVLTGGLGYRYVTGKNLEIDASYDFEGRDGFEGQTASLRFKLPF